MRGVTDRREALPAEHVAGCDAHVLLGNGCELAPQRVERLAVEPPRRAFEPRRVDEVRGTYLGDPDRKPWVAPHERLRGARVIEVNVREQQVADVLDAEAVVRQPG